MKTHHKIILALSLVFGEVCACYGAKLPLVVISQIVEHDALNKEREGIVAALKAAGYIDGKTIRIVYENAQGNIAMATQIASSFSSQNPDVAVGISTPSAQSLIQPMAKQGIPVVFTAVTDPVEARIVSSFGKRSEAVTGVSDGTPLKPQLELIQKLVPTAKVIGVLYNPGEANSAKAVSILQELAPQMGFSLELATTSKSADTMMSAVSLIGKADVIFIPLDNTAMTSITGIVALGRNHKVPIFTPDVDSVEKGVLAVRAPSHFTMGYKTGQMVVKILKGENAGDLFVEVDHPLELAINKTSVEAVGIKIPDELEQKAKMLT